LSPGRLHGLQYRFLRRHPDEDVSDLVLADRIRSSIGPLEHELDLPHVHVMVHDHIAKLHGEVSLANDVERLVEAVRAVSGVRGVDSHLHVGLLPGDTRPSRGRHGLQPPSPALATLLDAAAGAGASDAPLFAVHAVVGVFLDLVPLNERNHVFAHLPHDVRVILTAPTRRDEHGADEHGAKARSVDEFIAAVAAADPRLDTNRASTVATAVLKALNELVPEERHDIASVLPRDIRNMWHGLETPAGAAQP
jgi:uncharacterized protein (DUF2267 family)